MPPARPLARPYPRATPPRKQSSQAARVTQFYQTFAHANQIKFHQTPLPAAAKARREPMALRAPSRADIETGSQVVGVAGAGAGAGAGDARICGGANASAKAVYLFLRFCDAPRRIVKYEQFARYLRAPSYFSAQTIATDYSAQLFATQIERTLISRLEFRALRAAASFGLRALSDTRRGFGGSAANKAPTLALSPCQ